MHACRTGVCVECDAGMCKSFFHVTCAQEQVEVINQSTVFEVSPLHLDERYLSLVFNNIQ